MSKIRTTDYHPTKDSILLLDTNILINLFYPVMSTAIMADYEKLYEKLIARKSKLLLPAMQVSEFINRCIRFQYDLYKKNNGYGSEFEYKKDYRDTEDYRNSMESILDIVKNDILSVFTVIDDGFSTIDQNSIYIYGFSYDFNDALLVQIAKNNHASIVTHDSDFGNYNAGIDYITSNRKLLMFS